MQEKNKTHRKRKWDFQRDIDEGQFYRRQNEQAEHSAEKRPLLRTPNAKTSIYSCLKVSNNKKVMFKKNNFD